MATLGNVPAEAYTNTVKDSFSGNGSTTAFTMSLPTVTNDVRVVVENVIQDPTVAYSVSGTTLTFTSAPPTGTNNIYVVHLGPAVMTTVPPAEIADATTFASSLTVQGAFTSVGIDDNADAVALTIDSSENVLIGKTTSSSSSAGVEFRPAGLGIFGRDSNTALLVNRNTNDGTLIDLRKDGTTVGTIGVTSSNNLIIANPTSNHSGVVFGTNTILPAIEDDYADGLVDLGNTSERFRDAYLSGGIYLGGVGSANKLDDYESGSWTPADSSGASLTLSVASATYVKIGKFVMISFDITYPSTGTTNASSMSGLPFTVSNTGAGALSTGYDTMLPVGDANKWWIGAGSSNAYSFGRTNADLSGGRMIGSGVYIAN